VPVRQDADTGRVIVAGQTAGPGSVPTSARDLRPEPAHGFITRQHTLPVELRISDVHSWEISELRGEAHHEAYKCRQLLTLLDRLFAPQFTFPPTASAQLRRDQDELFR